ncbi:hypothetical protein ACSBL2_17990 [Pedobacter sp. AW31-3R]|uniref:hypothetical protein n=1 Tax=Pedobacter sp. AW31-3R TaxID=3445781 RepID=UPI003FA177D0
MKSLLFALAGLLAFAINGQAQPKKSGAIQFVSTFDPAAMASANGIKLSDEMIARMPSSSKTDFELLFNLTNASYMRVEEIEDSNGGPGGGGPRFGGFGGSDKEYYYNFAAHQLTEASDINDTTYFLQNKLGAAAIGGFGNMQSPPVIEVLKSDETKQILGFNCKKVTIKSTSKRRIQEEEKEITEETTLWYTDELGFDFSPNPALWTEGAVLAVEGRGNTVLAKSIEYRNVSSRDVNLPKKGTPITAEAYKAKMESRMKQMRNRNGARGQMRTMSIN